MQRGVAKMGLWKSDTVGRGQTGDACYSAYNSGTLDRIGSRHPLLVYIHFLACYVTPTLSSAPTSTRRVRQSSGDTLTHRHPNNIAKSWCPPYLSPAPRHRGQLICAFPADPHTHTHTHTHTRTHTYTLALPTPTTPRPHPLQMPYPQPTITVNHTPV